jgi:hypothetical protein
VTGIELDPATWLPRRLGDLCSAPGSSAPVNYRPVAEWMTADGVRIERRILSCHGGRLVEFSKSAGPGLALLLLWAVTLRAQSSSFVVITPQSATLLTGESRSFRLVDQNGQFQRNVTWTISDPDALQATPGDELTITAKHPGDFHIDAQSKSGSAEASVKVMEGQLPVGTKIWTTPTAPGMHDHPACPSHALSKRPRYV